VGEQGVQERAQNAPWWGPSVEDQRGGDVVSYLHHLGETHQKVQDPVAQGWVETQGLKLNDEFRRYHGVECLAVVNEQHSYIGIFLVQMG
jgi:hypothetical protein